MIRCPACGGELRDIDPNPFPIRVCDACRGGLFPLRRLVEHVQGPHVQKIAAVTPENSKAGKRLCPTCRRWMLMTTLLNRVGSYDLEVCNACAVVWFDPGELSQAPVTPETVDRTKIFYEEHRDIIDRYLDGYLNPRSENLPLRIVSPQLANSVFVITLLDSLLRENFEPQTRKKPIIP